MVQGVKQRMINGMHENTPFRYHSFESTLEVLRRKNVQLEQLRFDKLNHARKYLSRAKSLDAYKRFVMSVSHSDLHARVHKVVSVARRNHMGIHAILDKLDRANRHLYSSTSYDENDFQRSYLLWKLGGQRAADIGARSLGLPSLSATRQWDSIHPLIASPHAPTDAEMAQNLRGCLPLLACSESDQPRPPTAYVLLIDEIKLEERFRWDPATNTILGVCREHSELCSLEFRSREEIQVLGELLSAKSATVIAVAELSDKHHEYAARPFVISGTCKREDAEEHAQLLRRVIRAVRLHIRASGGKLYSISSDGESRRCKALGLLTLCLDLSTSSPLYRLLAPLPLFNRLVGEEDIVCDKDWRHVLKRLRNTLLRAAPVHVNGCTITRPMIKRHLVEGLGLHSSTADSLLSPNDPQDVVLAFRLLNAIATLPPPPSNSTPMYHKARTALRLLGRVYSRLLQCYTDIKLSLREQLEQLSAVAHLLIVLYVHDKGGFLPAILYLNVQLMIKNAYFCLAKILVHNPDAGALYIICLGTDALEKIFGLVRTMIGSDANVDQLQSIQNGTVDHDAWQYPLSKGEAMTLQLQLTMSIQDPGLVTSQSEVCFHRHVVLSLPTCDMLCPFADGKLVYLGGLRTGDHHEDEVQLDAPLAEPTVSSLAPGASDPESQAVDAYALEPDLEDLLGAEDVSAHALGQSPAAPKVDAWLPVSNTPGAKKQHKSTFLRLLSQNPESFTSHSPGSTDRLSRVCGYTRYANSQVILDDETEFGESTLGFDDPAITLVRVNGLLFLAIIQICDIKCGGQSTCSLKVEELTSADVRIKFGILALHSVIPTVDNRESDWKWNGRFESFHSTSTREVEGRAVQPIDPQLVSDLTLRATGGISHSTYQFRTVELRALACPVYRYISLSHGHRLAMLPL
ncbi:hypothetical protein C2E23DRAFT_886092 [Lenzites betulinus]|nr:hypothetical protein C2E23DRAFT_886092 [Lenzites betulinus]